MKTSDELIIIGAGGHSKVVEEIARLNGYKVRGFLDDSQSGALGRISDAENFKDCDFVIAIGNNVIREKIVAEHSGLNFASLVHPKAVVSGSATIGDGTVVMAGAIINPDAKVGNHCIINTGAIVEHDNEIADFVHISPNATLCGTVRVGERTHIGAGVTVRNNLNITADCIIGVGSAVVKDIEKAGIYVGVPAKELKK